MTEVSRYTVGFAMLYLAPRVPGIGACVAPRAEQRHLSAQRLGGELRRRRPPIAPSESWTSRSPSYIRHAESATDLHPEPVYDFGMRGNGLDGTVFGFIESE
jgi:hypothetical protein